MIKKISAVLLALVLCLSVIVVPASALELGSANVAFELKWDKEYYSAGETAYLEVYMKASESLELGTGSILIGTNSAQITQDTTHVDAVGSDLWNSFWKEPAASQGGWQAATIAGRVDTANNDTEKALYNQYLKIVIARNTSGDHENAGNNKQGLPGADINALADAGEPIITFAFVVGDVADGTKLNAAITTGSLTCSPAQTSFKSLRSPGTATTTDTVAAAAFDVSAAVAEATVGEPEPAGPSFVIAQGKDAIRFNKDGDAYKNISIRTSAEIALEDLQTACKGATENDAIEDFIVEAGFVYIPATETFSVDAAKQAIADITVDLDSSNGYTKKMVSYIQNTGSAYKYTCVVDIKDEAIASAAFNTFAYIMLDYDNDGTADETCYYEAENSISAKALYNAKVDLANSTYGWTLATK